MRRLLVERARRYKSQKHGGQWKQVELSDGDLITVGTPDQIVALDEAMERLGSEDPEASELVKLVMFGGFSVEEGGATTRNVASDCFSALGLRTSLAQNRNLVRRGIGQIRDLFQIP